MYSWAVDGPNVVRREPSELKRLLLHWAIKLVIFYETFAGSYYFYRECFLPEMQKTENYISIFQSLHTRKNILRIYISIFLIISIYQKCQYRDNYKRCANMAFLSIPESKQGMALIPMMKINYKDNGYLPEEELLQRSCLLHWIR